MRLLPKAGIAISLVCAGFVFTGCGGSAGSGNPPIILSVSLSNPTVDLVAGGSSVSVPVIILAPTETATFRIDGLPSGVAENYKESESNPSGLLTLTAASSVTPGTYMPMIVVGSSGQTASFVFTLVVKAGK